jgi:hypothetical protein
MTALPNTLPNKQMPSLTVSSNKLVKWFRVAAIIASTLAAVQAAPSTTGTAKGKLKVFILVGQSNMEGHAKIETFDYIDYMGCAKTLAQIGEAFAKATLEMRKSK